MADVKQTLNGFLDYSSPKLSTFLARTWKNQQQAITYKELRSAIYAGQLDMTYLTQWQQDYSKFVIDAYSPLAQQAIDNAAQGIMSKYGLGTIDVTPGYIDQFIANNGGKLIREVSETQYKAINVLVRQASMNDNMTVDELARAIRPTVGLTTRQSQAAMHVYEQAIADGYTPKQARNIQARYAERMHRRRAATIAQTEMAFAYNAGQLEAVRQAIKDGLLAGAQKEWSTSLDELVCDECGPLDGEIVDIESNFSNGLLVPPAHPNCRCTVSYILTPATAFQTQTATAAGPQPLQSKPYIPEDFVATGLKYEGKGNLGGTGEMHILADPDDEDMKFIFKPAQQKYSSKAEPFRAYAQEAGYKVQFIVDPDSSVECGTITFDIPGKGPRFGAVQRMVTDIDGSFNLHDWQLQGGTLDPSIISQIQRENVTDWLLCNYDSHGRNFVLTNGGTLFGLDKEQAFRYIGQSEAKTMSLTFHPNAVFHETEPVYNTLYKRFVNGEIDIRLNDTLAYIKRVEAIPDAEYREIFRQYAEALHGKGAQAEQLLDQIVARKQGLRNTFETFYSELLTKRKGTKTVFQFVDNAAAAAATQPSPIISTLSPATLKSMKLADLQALAKAKGIKSFGIMHKQELIDAISDPSKVQASIDSAKARYAQLMSGRQQRRAAQAAAQAAQGKTINGVQRLSDALNDIDGALQGHEYHGVGLISDSTALEGLEVNLRKITVDGTEYYELSGKLSQTRWEQALLDMSPQQSGSYWRFNVGQGVVDYSKPIAMTSSTESIGFGTKYIRNGDDIIIVAGQRADTEARAMMGQFNIRVQASNGAEAARKMRQLMQQANLTDITDDVTEEAITRYKKMRVIWQTDPREASRLNPAAATDAEIDNVLHRLGITQKRIDSIEIRKVSDGYWTLYDPENLRLAKQYDVAYLYHEASSLNGAAAVVKSGELLATTNRYNMGIITQGASSSADIRTGGADSVFTRIVYKHNIGTEERYGSFGDYVFVFEPETLTRTDWYAYEYDEFGTTELSTFSRRYGTEELFRRTSASYSRSNEILFRKALPLKTLREIRVPASEVQDMIDKLHSMGITQINGIRVEKLVKAGGRTV